jgi:hypothetical protein
MRLKSVVKYNLSEMKNGILIFYGVILLIFVLFTISVVNLSRMDSHSSLSGIEIASAIFLFVSGISFFKQNFLFLSANGVTRKTQFSGFIISSVIISLIMAAIDTVYGNVIPEFENYRPLFRQVYSDFVKTESKFAAIFIGFVCTATLYLLMTAFGYLIRTLYYRMSRTLKIVVSVGVPALYSVILPVLDFKFTKGKVSMGIMQFFCTVSGLNGQTNPYITILFDIACTVIMLCLAYLLVRRAPLKE